MLEANECRVTRGKTEDVLSAIAPFLQKSTEGDEKEGDALCSGVAEAQERVARGVNGVGGGRAAGADAPKGGR